MLEALLYIAAGLYLIEYLFFRWGIARALGTADREIAAGLSARPHVSVVIAARNEQGNIGDCMASMASQTYPSALYEVICVDDDSDDRTGEILRAFARDESMDLTVFSPDSSMKDLAGKPRAIDAGVAVATGSVVMMTDGDCIVPPTWIENTVRYFEEGADVVAGFTVVDGRTFFGRLQQLDWLHLQSIAAASLAFDSPVGVVGNNLAFRKSGYEAIGGYRSLPFSITEDFTLALALWRNGAKVVYPCDSATRVTTKPCPDLPAVLRQKHRWGRGGMESTPHGYSILVVALLMLCALLIAPFVSPLAWGIVWGTKFLSDVLLLAPVSRRLGVASGLRAFVPFQFYFLAQALVVPVMVVNPNVRWKGRVFETVKPGVARK